jgi:hypothetical protein
MKYEDSGEKVGGNMQDTPKNVCSNVVLTTEEEEQCRNIEILLSTVLAFPFC